MCCVNRQLTDHATNQITFIGHISSKYSYRRPRLITKNRRGWDTTGWNKSGEQVALLMQFFHVVNKPRSSKAVSAFH